MNNEQVKSQRSSKEDWMSQKSKLRLLGELESLADKPEEALNKLKQVF